MMLSRDTCRSQRAPAARDAPCRTTAAPRPAHVPRSGEVTAHLWLALKGCQKVGGPARVAAQHLHALLAADHDGCYEGQHGRTQFVTRGSLPSELRPRPPGRALRASRRLPRQHPRAPKLARCPGSRRSGRTRLHRPHESYFPQNRFGVFAPPSPAQTAQTATRQTLCRRCPSMPAPLARRARADRRTSAGLGRRGQSVRFV